LFWKKKKKVESRIEVDDSEVRGAFRVEPPDDRPIKFSFLGKDITIKDISVTGVSFTNQGFEIGMKDKVTLHLPGVSKEMTVELEIVAIIAGKNLCGTKFNGLSEQQDDLLSKYIVNAQKETLS
tara:strand:+ start:55 stop:426 length:372 start_codon:yes stop_codon:yes gene_type:complete